MLHLASWGVRTGVGAWRAAGGAAPGQLPVDR
jgi:hypothetical protein